MNKKESKFYIGVEGGATKSEAILTDENLKILMRRKGGALNYHSLSRQTVVGNLKALLTPLLKKSSGGKLGVVFGLAGIDGPTDEKFYKDIIKKILDKSSIFNAVNDSKIALEGKCPDEKNRIVLIAGTGSNAYGENSAGKSANTLWWDFILGDEGSGYYFGLKALQAAARSADGRIPKTELEKLVLKTERARTFEDFYSVFYNDLSKKENMKAHIASFAPLIDRAIKAGDAEAIQIRNEGAGELALGVYTVARRLGFLNREFCLGMIGSTWKMPGLGEVFRKEVRRHCPKVRFSDNTDSGAWGAVLLARKL